MHLTLFLQVLDCASMRDAAVSLNLCWRNKNSTIPFILQRENQTNGVPTSVPKAGHKLLIMRNPTNWVPGAGPGAGGGHRAARAGSQPGLWLQRFCINKFTSIAHVMH